MPRCRECGADLSLPEDSFFDDDRREVIATGERRRVPPTLWDFLEIFRGREGRTVSRQFVRSQVWVYAGRQAPMDATIDNCVHRIRRLISGTPFVVVTVPSHGWRFERR